jgi:hypothetical protein
MENKILTNNNGIPPQEMADKIVAMYSMDEYVSDFHARKYALMAIELVISARPTKRISDSAIEYDYEYWQEVKYNL